MFRRCLYILRDADTDGYPSPLVFYKPYESQGQAWPITFARLIWGVAIYLIFMSGIFILKKSYILSSLLVPLLGLTVVWAWKTNKVFRPLSKFVSLSAVFEVQRGEDTADVLRLRTGHPVTWSQRCVLISLRPRIVSLTVPQLSESQKICAKR